MDEKKILPEGNFLDRAISYFAPGLGAKRLKSRYVSTMMADQVRKYKAAGYGKRTSGWHAPGSSANTEVAIGGNTLRNRSRDLVRNDVYAAKAVKGIAANVVGSGIRPSIRHEEEAVVQKAKKLWEEWGESTLCDLDNQLNVYGLQFLIMRAVAESGEVFIRKVRDAKSKIPFKIQVLEADFLDTTKDGIVTESGGYIQLGIEFNKKGKRVAYWLFEDHPGENKIVRRLESVRVPASEIIHNYFVERPGQIRGIPFGVGAFIKMKDFAEYEDAQLIRQKIAACFSVFIQTSDDPNPGSVNPNGGAPLERVEPGIIEYLHPGQSVSFGNPPPTEGYDLYARKTLQGIAAGYDVTYELLTNDLSNVNFSSGRMGWIEFGRMVHQWQSQIIINQMMKRIFNWFVESSFIAGLLPEDVSATWTSPRREMIDPLKETKGLVEAVRGGLNSWQGAVRELGRDPDVVRAELAEDKGEFDALGLKLSTDPEHDANRSDTEEDVDDGEGEGKKKPSE